MQLSVNRVVRWRVLLTAITFLPPAAACGQGIRADYDRANRLRESVRDTVFKAKVVPHWFAEGTRFWYRNDLPEGNREFIVVDAVGATREPAFDHAKLAEALTTATGSDQQQTRVPLDSIRFHESEDAFCFRLADKRWKCDLDTYALSDDDCPDADEGEAGRSAGRHRRQHSSPRGDESPDGRWVVSIQDHNLFLRAKDTGEECLLSSDGVSDDAYEPGVFWSPDSGKFVALRTKEGDDRQVYLIESSPKDQLQPKLHSFAYLKPGDQIPITKPHLFDVAQRRQIPIDERLFSNPWNVDDFHWFPDSRRFAFLYNQRGHQVLRVIAVDALTGEGRVLIDESSKTFVDYAQKKFLYYLDKTHEMIWMSERDGWNHLYLCDSHTGQVKHRITQGNWVVRSVDRVDEEDGQVWFQASGIYPEQDPYYVHFCRVNVDGTGLVVLTDGNGTHSIEYSPDRRFLVDTYSRVDTPSVTELRCATSGRLIVGLERADISALLATGWQVPERFVAKGRDGETEIYGVIYRPTTFDPNKKYPVIEAIYAGPHGSFVPKAFDSFHDAQVMAELGFILVQIDGMGTSNRSKAFHDVCWKNLGDSGFPDRILWISAAAEKYPYIDINRVGIYGGSAGGQSSTRALLAHGDFYKVAVSDCGCHDNRMDKIWWNELWMGWPVGPHYAEQSNVTQAGKLQGKLLLIVGELDRNVDPSSTMQLVDALIKNDKDFDLLIVPGSGHGIGGPYGIRRRQDFFVRHLLNVEPRGEPQ